MDYIYHGKPLKTLDMQEFCHFLEEISSKEKAEFDKKIIKTSLKIFGLNAKQIAEIYKYFHNNGYDNILSFPSKTSYEISLLQARLVLNDKSLSFDKRLDYIKNWIKDADCWAQTDGLFSSYRLKMGEKDQLLLFAESLVSQSAEFEIRLGVIILLDYFLNDEDIAKTFSLLSKIEYGKYYYVDMAVAWLCATALINYEEATLDFLSQPFINEFTFKKSLQKARESFRISAERKDFYKLLFLLK